MFHIDENIVSIVIPVYNGAQFIGKTLTSILNQSYTKLEIIIIDDGSVDQTKHLVEKFSDKRISYIYQNNSGVSIARNNGFEMSSGEYLIFFDADDVMSENFIEKRVQRIEKSDLDFCGSDVFLLQNDIINFHQKFSSITGDLFESIVEFNNELKTCPSSYMFRRKFLTESKIKFNENLTNSADKYFLLEVCQHAKYGYVLDAPLHYRVHSMGMSQKVKHSNIEDGKVFLRLVSTKLNMERVRRKRFLSRKNYNISAEYFRLSPTYFIKSFIYLSRSFYNSPSIAIRLLFDNLSQ